MPYVECLYPLVYGVPDIITAIINILVKKWTLRWCIHTVMMDGMLNLCKIIIKLSDCYMK